MEVKGLIISKASTRDHDNWKFSQWTKRKNKQIS